MVLLDSPPGELNILLLPDIITVQGGIGNVAADRLGDLLLQELRDRRDVS
jgi:hypothetical protein